MWQDHLVNSSQHSDRGRSLLTKLPKVIKWPSVWLWSTWLLVTSSCVYSPRGFIGPSRQQESADRTVECHMCWDSAAEVVDTGCPTIEFSLCFACFLGFPCSYRGSFYHFSTAQETTIPKLTLLSSLRQKLIKLQSKM